MAWLSFFLSTKTVAAGAWTPKPGHGYAKTWVKWLPGFLYMKGDGTFHNYGAYHELFINAYAEVGLLPNLAIWTHFPMLRQFWLEDPRNQQIQHHITPGDPALGLRFQLLKFGRFRLSPEVSLRAPLASNDPVQTVYSTENNFQEIAQLRMGRGMWEVQAGLSLGYAWDRTYLGLQLSLLFPLGDFDTVFTWSIENGWSFGQNWSLRVRLTGWFPLGNGTASYQESLSGLGHGTRYIGLAIECDYQFFPKWYLGLTLEGGAGALLRQTGGPVISPYLAFRF